MHLQPSKIIVENCTRGPFAPFFWYTERMSTRPDPEQSVRNFFRDYCISGTLSPTEAETPVSSAALRSAQVMPAAALADQTLLAAVSGGADSLFLLIMLHTLAPEYGFTLSAVTVNHRMRSEEESGGDAGFVQEFCAALNPPVPCYRIDFPEGAVFALAKTRGRGEEDAARVLRYREFDRIARQSGVRWICTGHTRNDQLETLLMRTLQGSPVGAKRGIAPISGRIMRPLLGVDRRDLEKWLRARGYSWREDHTNREERYLRNRIRSRLVPVLDASFAGWARGMLDGARKAAVDEQLISSFPLPELTISPAVPVLRRIFVLHPALRIGFIPGNSAFEPGTAYSVCPGRKDDVRAGERQIRHSGHRLWSGFCPPGIFVFFGVRYCTEAEKRISCVYRFMR